MGSGFWDTGRCSNLPYLGMKLAIGQSSRSCTYTVLPPGGGGGRNWNYFRSIGSGFRDMGQFLNLPYLGMELGHWPSPRSCRYTPFLPQGVQIELIFALWAAVCEKQANFQNCHIWAWNLAKVQKLHTYTFSTSGGGNWAYFHSTVSGFWDIDWSDFQNCHIWPLVKVPEVAHVLSTPGGRNWGYFWCTGHVNQINQLLSLPN